MHALQSRIRAFPVLPLLLLLAALAGGALLLARGQDSARALGPSYEGICEYGDAMRLALLSHLKREYFQCDETPLMGAGDAWAGDLDVEPFVGATFAPGKGELDGYKYGSRVDLRGSGLGVADLDVSAALRSHGTPTYQRFGVDSLGSRNSSRNSGGFVGLTFLLDGAAASASGLAASSYSGTEGQIVWLTFQWSSIPDEFAKWNDTDAADDGFYLVLKLHVELEGDERQIFFMVNSEDALRTLYAAPFLIPDDPEIERTERADVTLSAVAVFDQRSGIEAPAPNHLDPRYRGDQDDKFEAIERAIARNDDSRLSSLDDDAPRVDVCDRSRTVRDALVAEVSGKSDCDRISVSDLTKIRTLNLSDRDIEQLKAGDFSGLTKITSLDLSKNDLAALPAGVFEGAGSDLSGPSVAVIDVTLNPGPRGVGFSRRNVSSAFRQSVGPRQAVRLARHEVSDRPDYGLAETAYSVREGQTLVLGVSALASSAVVFRSLAGDSGTYQASDCKAPCEAPAASEINAAGEYLLGFAAPTDADDDADTFTVLYGSSHDAVDLNSVVSIARLTVTEGPAAPPPAASIFKDVRVAATFFSTTRDYPEFPYNPDLDHNISNLRVSVGGQNLNANFLEYYNRTGRIERWGFATSEVLEIEPGTLTQFFQRGVIDFHDVGAGWIVERRLAWDYFGGDAYDRSRDQGFEAAPAGPPAGASSFFPAFQHYVAETATDGTRTGFLTFFNRLGGVDSFGFPKTEARRDTGAANTLFEGKTAGFVRQYFQAAIFQLASGGQVQLTLLGDSLRDLLVPDHADHAAFRRADAFAVGQVIVPQKIG